MTEILEWKCPVCSKVISSLYPKQFEWQKRTHEIIHQMEKK